MQGHKFKSMNLLKARPHRQRSGLIDLSCSLAVWIVSNSFYLCFKPYICTLCTAPNNLPYLLIYYRSALCKGRHSNSIKQLMKESGDFCQLQYFLSFQYTCMYMYLQIQYWFCNTKKKKCRVNIIISIMLLLLPKCSEIVLHMYISLCADVLFNSRCTM